MLNGLYIKATETEIEELETLISDLMADKHLETLNTMDERVMYVGMTALQGKSLQLTHAQIKQILDMLNVYRLINDLQNKNEEFSFENKEHRATFVNMVNDALKIGLDDEQLEIFLETQNESIKKIEEEILAKLPEKLRPEAKLALQTSLSLAFLYLAPELLLLHTGTALSRKLIEKSFGLYGKGLSLLVTPALLSAGWYFQLPQISQFSLINRVLPEMITTASPWIHIPLTMFLHMQQSKYKVLENASEPLQKLATMLNDETVVETAGDFFDIMHGQADDSVLNKYKGSLATMTVDEMAQSLAEGASWVWNKIPSIRKNH